MEDLIMQRNLFSIFLFVLLCAGALTANKPALTHAQDSCCAERVERVLAASFYDADNYETSITLNNKGPLHLPVTLKFYGSAGEPFVTEVKVPPTSFRTLSLNKLLAGKSAYYKGNLQIAYKGKWMECGSQIRMVAGHVALDEQLQLLDFSGAAGDQTFQATWWKPSGTFGRVIVSNTANELTSVRLGNSYFQLWPHQTMTLALTDITPDADNGSISLNYFGKKGAIISRLLLEDYNSGFSLSLPFEATSGQSRILYGTGIRWGNDYRPVVVASNASNSLATVRCNVAANNSLEQLPDLVIQAHGVATTDPVALDGNLNTGSISCSVPALVHVTAMSVSSNNDFAGRVPMQDPQAQRSSTGGYPWYAESELHSLAHITNTTGFPQTIMWELNSDGEPGKLYSREQTLGAGETLSLDPQKLRDEQTPDGQGRTIPPSAVRGQIRWSVVDVAENSNGLGIIGRAEFLSDTQGWSATYACQDCCQASDTRLEFGQNSYFAEAGEPLTVSLRKRRQNCYGAELEPRVVTTGLVDSGDFGVNGLVVIPWGPGSFYLSAQSTLIQWFSNESSYCRRIAVAGFATTRLDAYRVIINDPVSVKDGQKGFFSASVIGNAPAVERYEWGWKAPEGAGNNPQVNFEGNDRVTSAKGHWFAIPASNQCTPNDDATYTVSCTVHFAGGKTARKETRFTVNPIWSPAGQVSAPKVTGGPGLAYDSEKKIWYVQDKGTLSRTEPVKTMFVLATSQFYHKVEVHEDVHVRQWGPGGSLYDLFQVNDLMRRLYPLTAATSDDLVITVNDEFFEWRRDQQKEFESRRQAIETEAYTVSDPIAPMYIYQLCAGIRTEWLTGGDDEHGHERSDMFIPGASPLQPQWTDNATGKSTSRKVDKYGNKSVRGDRRKSHRPRRGR